MSAPTSSAMALDPKHRCRRAAGSAGPARPRRLVSVVDEDSVLGRGQEQWGLVENPTAAGQRVARSLARNVHPVIWERSADRCRSAQVIGRVLPCAANVAWKSMKGPRRCQRPREGPDMPLAGAMIGPKRYGTAGWTPYPHHVPGVPRVQVA